MYATDQLLQISATLALLSVTVIGASDYDIIWNVPSRRCMKAKIDLKPEQYDITANAGQQYYGERIALFHEFRFGLYPYFNHSDPNKPVNGGLPQNINLQGHLDKVKQDVEAVIPNKDFSGVAIIDFEEWKPIYSANWNRRDVYQKQSIKSVQERYPDMNDATAKKTAEEEFNNAAEEVMVQTIRTCKNLRPKAKWGFYGFPYCNANAGENGENTCSQLFQDINDKQSYVMEESTALFPSIYFFQQFNDNRHFLRVQASMKETGRFASASSDRKPVYVYTRFEYGLRDVPEGLYTQQDLCRSLKQARELGADGALLWSQSKGLEERCASLQTYMQTVFGPYAREVRTVPKVCEDGNCQSTDQCL